MNTPGDIRFIPRAQHTSAARGISAASANVVMHLGTHAIRIAPQVAHLNGHLVSPLSSSVIVAKRDGLELALQHPAKERWREPGIRAEREPNFPDEQLGILMPGLA